MPFSNPAATDSVLAEPAGSGPARFAATQGPGPARFAATQGPGPARLARPGPESPGVPPPSTGGRTGPQGESPASPGASSGTPAASGTIRRRIPELAVGVVLVGLGAIGALMLAGREAPRASVLVWAGDVTRGQVVAETDLAAASIDVDVPVDVVDVSAAGDVIGRTVAFDAAAGGFVSDAVLEAGAVIPPDFALVGLRLGAGRYPVSTLAAGDVVDLLTTEPLVGWDNPVVVSGVEVFDVQWLGGEGGEALVSLLVPRDATARVAAAAEGGPRLAEVAR